MQSIYDRTYFAANPQARASSPMASRTIAGTPFPTAPEARRDLVVNHLNNKAVIPSAKAMRDRVTASHKGALLPSNAFDEKFRGDREKCDPGITQRQASTVQRHHELLVLNPVAVDHSPVSDPQGGPL